MKQRGGGPNAQAPRIAAYAHAGGKTTFLILTRGSVSREFAVNCEKCRVMLRNCEFT